MSSESSDADSAPTPLPNDTLPFEMGGDARVTGDETLPPPVNPEELPTIGHIGRYVLKFKVGQGGLGDVFAAHDPLLSRLIAIKTVKPRLAVDQAEDRESFNTHFLNEARAAAGLSHPNIVTVFDAGVSPQGAYIAMELLKGRDLRQMRADGSRPTAVQAALIVRRVADALAYAHAQGVVHCDVKPANIFMVSPTQPKVLDFGIARIMNPATGLPGKQIGGGSPRYMAPEQLLGRDTDRRSDVFSLGVVLYELLTDTNPFARNTLDAITQAVVNHVPPLASLVDPAIPLGLAVIVSRAMEKNPGDRYQSARVFGRELRRWLDGQLEGSQGRDTGTDPVGINQPAAPASASTRAARIAGLGVITGPRPMSRSGAGSATGSGHSTDSLSTMGDREGSSGPVAAAAAAGAGTGKIGSHRGWTITGLAIVAVITTMGAVWLGDAGIGNRSQSQEFGPGAGTEASAEPAQGTSVAPATLPAPAPAQPTSADAALPDAASTAGAPSASDLVTAEPATRISSPASASVTAPEQTSDAAAVATALQATPAPAPAAAASASDPEAALPTVRLVPRVRENPIEPERSPARPQRASINASRDPVPINAREKDAPGFARRDQRLAPVATAVPTRLGFVDVHAMPAAEIDIDGNPGGSAAPYARLRMTEGTHVITLHRDGFQPRRMKVVVSESRPVTVAHTFR